MVSDQGKAGPAGHVAPPSVPSPKVIELSQASSDAECVGGELVLLASLWRDLGVRGDGVGVHGLHRTPTHPFALYYECQNLSQ